MKNSKTVLDIYMTELGKGYLLFEDSILVNNLLPGSKKPEGGFVVNRKPGILAKKMEAYFEGRKVDFNDKISFDGTEFEKKVINECQNIRYGQTITYKALVSRMGSNAYRAVGGVLSKNKLPVVVPCHRVIGSNDIGGWSGPKRMKDILLRIEKGSR